MGALEELAFQLSLNIVGRTRCLTFVGKAVGIEEKGRCCCPQNTRNSQKPRNTDGLVFIWETPEQPSETSVEPARQLFFSPYVISGYLKIFHLAQALPDLKDDSAQSGDGNGFASQVGSGRFSPPWNSLMRLKGTEKRLWCGFWYLSSFWCRLVEAGAAGRKEGVELERGILQALLCH